MEIKRKRISSKSKTKAEEKINKRYNIDAVVK